MRVDTGTYKVVYFAFGFEAINNAAHRAEVMGRVLGWLTGKLGAADTCQWTGGSGRQT